MAYHVTSPEARRWSGVTHIPVLQKSILVGADQGAVHLEIALCRLEPGAAVPAHLHPYEESWYALGGTGSWAGGGLRTPRPPGHGMPRADAFFFPADWKGLSGW